MPKKATRYAHVRESASTATTTTVVVAEKAKRHRSVHIGPRNGRRWLSLKKRLGLLSDDDLVVYLLDLADSIAARRDEMSQENVEPWKTQDTQEKETISSPEAQSPVHDVLHIEMPRRSLRKHATPDESAKNDKPAKADKLSSSSNNPDKLPYQDSKSYSKSCVKTSRTKRHKNKTRHHKEKRKKRKHQKMKDLKDLVSLDSKITSNVTWEFDSGTDTEKCSTDLPSNFNEQTAYPQSSKDTFSTDSDKILSSEKLCLNVSQEICSDIEKTDVSIGQKITSSAQPVNTKAVENQSKQISDVQSNLNDSKTFLITSLEASQTLSTDSTKILSNEKILDSLEYEDCESLSKRYKRKNENRHESGESGSILEELDKSYCKEPTTPVHKKDKKRHKGGDSQSKKHRDVRRAPQDGKISADENEYVSCSNDRTSMPIKSSSNIVPDNSKLSSEVVTDNSSVDPPRLAIKIKLCQECNSRHLQDACPFVEPQYTVKDSITLDQWIQKYNKNSEVMKAFNSNDPMSQGYGKHTDNDYESDEEVPEQYKSKNKMECEEKQLSIDSNKPLYSRDSLPDCLEFKLSNIDHGLGVFVKTSVPMYAQLGPLIGKPVQEMDIPDDFPMRHIWEVDINCKTLYVSTMNPITSNWIRYVRPAETKDDRNVAIISKNGELSLVTSKNLAAGTELTYWSDSQSTAWTRKNKIDKTNCGGCNLNFAHPIYYRLHCCIFHDTNYSLTIRKYHCKVCGEAVLGKDNIMKHAAQLHAGRGAYQCQYCKKFFLRLNYLEMHRTYGCSQNPQRSRPLCDFCGRKFCQPQKLKVHIKRMHSDMSEVLREFQCKLCLKLLGSRAALQRHMKEVHHKDVVGAATCDRCGKMFQNKSNLKIHMLTHSGVKPFKCKENGCKAAFTTKQCLQFHYKKVHGLSEDMMPKIERSVAYTFDAYSGGLAEDVGRGKIPKFNSNNTQENSDSLASFDECSNENNNAEIIADVSCSSDKNLSKELNENEESNHQMTIDSAVRNSPVESTESDVDLYSTSRKISKKWIGEFDVAPNTPSTIPTPNVYDFQNNRRESVEEKIQLPSHNQHSMDDTKLGLSMYRRTESSNASLLVEAALDAAEREIGAVSSPILEDSDREANLYSIPNELDFKAACSQSQMVHKSPNGHLNSYMQDDIVTSPAGTPHARHTPPSHIHLDYHLHRPVDYINATSRTHNIEQYLDQQDLQRVIHVPQESSTSPSRYQEIPHPHSHPQPHHLSLSHTHPHHHQVANEAISSDEGDSVAQNLSLPMKEKSLQQLEFSKYDGIDNDFSLVNRERVRFESLIVPSTADQGLDMSARGFQQTFSSQVQNSPHHHHHHLYEISERERQGVDLSRTSACMSPPAYSSPYAPPYSHVDVPRVVNLESASRSHHLHTSVSRIITSPQPASSLTSHLVPESLETRILSPPPPSMPTYNATYSVGPSPYHTSRTGYHYSGYY